MISAALNKTAPSLGVRELFARQQLLATYGVALLPLALLALLAAFRDPRTIDGVSIWAKPAKFLFSVAIFAITAAWFFGYVRPERRRTPLLRWTVFILIAAGSLELTYISWQAAHGLASHFNRSSAFYEIMYGVMGVGAVMLVSTTLPLAWEIARRPAERLRPEFVVSVVVGLSLSFLLGGGFGGYMAQQTGHSVGVVGGHFPIFGWNRSGGDLRIAHFLGIHAQQAIPILGVLVGQLPVKLRWPALVCGSMAYGLVAVAIFLQALDGRPLLPLYAVRAIASSAHSAGQLRA